VSLALWEFFLDPAEWGPTVGGEVIVVRGTQITRVQQLKITSSFVQPYNNSLYTVTITLMGQICI